MSKRLALSLCCGDYDINRALMDGSATADGIDLTVLTGSAPERHWRMIKHEEFDVCELSFGSYLAMVDQEAPISAIPAFPHRRFRHRAVYINTSSGIERPSDLAGKRVGVRSWQTTACFWMRGALHDEYDLNLADVEWFVQDPEDVPLNIPAGISVNNISDNTTVTEMLEKGELDALIYPETPAAIHRGDERVGHLFRDYREEERRYYLKTGFFPIMHTVVIHHRVLKSDPWVARSLLEAFRASKDMAYRRIENPRTVVLAFLADALAEQKRLMGDDPWAYDFARNQDQLSTLTRWAHEQGMTSRKLDPSELFAPSVLNDPPVYV